MSLSKPHRDLLDVIREREALDPGNTFGVAMTTSSETFWDRYNVWVHWRTARKLIRDGHLRATDSDPDAGTGLKLVAEAVEA